MKSLYDSQKAFLTACVLALSITACSGGSSSKTPAVRPTNTATPTPTPTLSPCPSESPDYPTPQPGTCATATATATPTGTPAALTLSPSPVAFNPVASIQTALITVSKPSAITSPLVLTFSDPTIVGATSPRISGSSATFTLIAVSAGSSSVTATDATGSTGSTSSNLGACGAPDAVNPQPVLLQPQNGATGVATTIGTLYFGVYTYQNTNPTIYLHMIVGQNQAFESGTLTPATLPSGTPTAPPAPSGHVLTYMSGTVPTLAAGTTYRAQLYDVSCEPALIAGSFST